jgi:hypothetical protein
MADIRNDIAEAEKSTFLSLLDDLRDEVLVDDEVTIQPDDSDVNQDLYEIGLLSTKATSDEVIFKINEIVTYLNKNLGV